MGNQDVNRCEQPTESDVASDRTLMSFKYKERTLVSLKVRKVGCLNPYSARALVCGLKGGSQSAGYGTICLKVFAQKCLGILEGLIPNCLVPTDDVAIPHAAP